MQLVSIRLRIQETFSKFGKTKSCKWYCYKTIKNGIKITDQLKIQTELRVF